MPVIEAKRRGQCTGCGGGILKGEAVHYTLASGTQHLTCTEAGAESRRNRHPRECQLCTMLLQPGKGLLSGYETAQGSTYKRHWTVTCVDIVGCGERIKAMYA